MPSWLKSGLNWLLQILTIGKSAGLFNKGNAPAAPGQSPLDSTPAEPPKFTPPGR